MCMASFLYDKLPQAHDRGKGESERMQLDQEKTGVDAQGLTGYELTVQMLTSLQSPPVIIKIDEVC
jgi:hypothetical protein